MMYTLLCQAKSQRFGYMFHSVLFATSLRSSSSRLISLYLIVMSHVRSDPIMYKSNHPRPLQISQPKLKPDTSSSSELIVADGGLVLGGAAHGVAGEDLRVVVDAGVEAEADGATDGLGHLALVHGAQTRLRRSLDPSVRRHELGDHGEVLLSR